MQEHHNKDWFIQSRYGLLVQYGLYSLIGRGEWVMNREGIPRQEYAALKDSFRAEKMDLNELCRRAVDWGMKYVVFTAKHHEGFCLYDSELTDFKSTNSPAKRDLISEYVQACRDHGLKVGIYFSLNDWHVTPGPVEALENPEEHYAPFIDFAHGQVRELMSNYGKIDILWYDGWWPYDGEGWRAEEMNAMARQLQPGILVNGRCGLKGDFLTPEKHLTSSREPWETCMPLKESWAWHSGDPDWKRPKDIAEMLRKCSSGCGNLLINTGPKGDGSIPEKATDILEKVGNWLKMNADSIYNTERFECYLRETGDGRSEWNDCGPFTASGNNFFLHARHWPGETLRVAGVRCRVKRVSFLADNRELPFKQHDDILEVTGLPRAVDLSMPVVIRFETDDRPLLYLCPAVRVPQVPHCHYDPLESDIIM